MTRSARWAVAPGGMDDHRGRGRTLPALATTLDRAGFRRVVLHASSTLWLTCMTSSAAMAVVMLALAAAPAFAADATGGAGGIGTSPANTGGAGGAAGADGLPAGTGGSAGTSGSPDGGTGNLSVEGGGGGGGFSPTFSGDVSTSSLGGNGGAGGSGPGRRGGGGGGGGDGAQISAGSSATVSATVTGGRGGGGANGLDGGAGGGGGAGVVMQTGSGLTVSAAVQAGDGGAGAVGALDGGGGGGGAGVVLEQGGSLRINATVSGGNGGGGGDGLAGGSGGSGVAANAKAAINVSAGVTVTGGTGSGVGSGGAGLTLSAGSTVANAGSISGGNGGGGTTLGLNEAAGGNGSGGAPGFIPNAALQGVGGVGIVGTGLSIVNSGSIAGGTAPALGPADAIDLSGSNNRLELQAGSAITGNVVVSGGGTNNVLALGGAASSSFDVSAVGGSGQYQGFTAFEKTGTSTWTLTGVSTFTGTTTINGGTLLAGNTGAFNASSATTINAGGTLDLGGFAQTIHAVSLAGGTLTNGSLTGAINSTGGTIDGIGGGASLAATSGTTVVNGTNTYSGGTTVTNATLIVNGSLSDPMIGAGGILTGTGSVGDTAIASGGTFAPGNGTPGSSMTVAGSLALQSGAIYVVMLNPTTASFANVTGTATLGGATVNEFYANGSYISKQYTILTAGRVSGTFGSLVNSNLPANFTTSLSYDPTHAYLNLALNFMPPSARPNFGGGLNLNQQNVANALTNFFNASGSIPMVFGSLTPSGLTQVSGELATGSQQATFDAMNLFMGVLTDPFVAGRGDGATSGSGAPIGYASTQTTGATRDAYAMFTKAPPAAFERHWSVWAAGYGGSQTTDGNTALGSNSTTSSIAGTVVGADYRISPYTLAGFALAGGGTSFSVANSGSGHSDLFQAGAFIRHTVGPAYISAALAYGWQDITTNRTVTAAGIDQLRAEFNASAFSGRLEGGYRLVSPWAGGIGLTPYAAAQFTTFDLPAYAEQATVGSNAFALAYNAKDVTDTRSELGIRTDKSWAMPDAILTLRGRLAWAHDFDPDRSIAATFQTLPGASFTVNGAAQAHDSALTTASVEMKWMNGWSAAATFEGEFSNATSSYAGKGVVRYAW